MVIARIQGGLGNQLFQYAFGRAIASTNGVELKVDVSFFATQQLREYQLHHFRVAIQPFSPRDRLEYYLYQRRPQSRATRVFCRLFPQGRLTTLHETSAAYDTTVGSARGNLYLVGYWQCEKYFNEIQSNIREELQLVQPPDDANRTMIATIESCNAVAVHIRRGDYVKNAKTNSVHGTCSTEYYQAATKYIAAHVTDPTFFVFSDDPAWAAENIHLPGRTVSVTHNLGARDYEDLRLMSHCRHFIIANSSFSWWGAWLSQQPSKIVVAPRAWFADPTCDSSDIVPEWWIRL